MLSYQFKKCRHANINFGLIHNFLWFSWQPQMKPALLWPIERPFHATHHNPERFARLTESESIDSQPLFHINDYMLMLCVIRDLRDDDDVNSVATKRKREKEREDEIRERRWALLLLRLLRKVVCQQPLSLSLFLSLSPYINAVICFGAKSAASCSGEAFNSRALPYSLAQISHSLASKLTLDEFSEFALFSCVIITYLLQWEAGSLCINAVSQIAFVDFLKSKYFLLLYFLVTRKTTRVD